MGVLGLTVSVGAVAVRRTSRVVLKVTVRFETRTTGPGRAVPVAADDPFLTRADPLASLHR